MLGEKKVSHLRNINSPLSVTKIQRYSRLRAMSEYSFAIQIIGQITIAVRGNMHSNETHYKYECMNL